MTLRYYVIAGVTAVGILGCMLIPKNAPGSGTTPELTSQALPDVDEDGKADMLHVLAVGDDQVKLQLESTATIKHDMLTFAGRGPMRFEPEGTGWRLVEGDGTPRAFVRLYKSEKNEKATTPNVIVTSGDLGKRYIFLERGFLKLDAHEVVPGFAVGMVLLGDAASVLPAVGTERQPDGTWVMPLETPITFQVDLNDEGRIKAVTYTSDRMKIKDNMTIGTPASYLDGFFPGQREANEWVAPRYGITGHIDPKDQTVASFTITYPWHDPKAPQPLREAPKK